MPLDAQGRLERIGRIETLIKLIREIEDEAKVIVIVNRCLCDSKDCPKAVGDVDFATFGRMQPYEALGMIDLAAHRIRHE